MEIKNEGLELTLPDIAKKVVTVMTEAGLDEVKINPNDRTIYVGGKKGDMSIGAIILDDSTGQLILWWATSELNHPLPDKKREDTIFTKTDDNRVFARRKPINERSISQALKAGAEWIGSLPIQAQEESSQ